MIPWTVACQDPLSMRLARQENCNGLPLPSPDMSVYKCVCVCVCANSSWTTFSYFNMSCPKSLYILFILHVNGMNFYSFHFLFLDKHLDKLLNISKVSRYNMILTYGSPKYGFALLWCQNLHTVITILHQHLYIFISTNWPNKSGN